jgi:hypothetical protein
VPRYGALSLLQKPQKKLELIQTQMAQKPMMRADVYARALRASRNVFGAEVWAATLRGGGGGGGDGY